MPVGNTFGNISSTNQRKWSLETPPGPSSCVSTVSRQQEDFRESHSTICGAPTPRGLKAGINPKVVSERIGHADVGFFLQTYAHVVRSDDREAAEEAAAFLIGDGDPSEHDR